MHIKINRKGFLTAIRIVENAIKVKKENSFTEGIKLKALKNEINITGINLEFQIKHTMKCLVEETGTAMIKIDEIKNILKNMTDEEIEIKSKESELIFKTQNGDFTTKTLENKEFPKHNFVEEEKFIFDKIPFSKLLEKSKICASKTPENLAVNCVKIDIEDDKMKFISTDTYRMMYLERKIEEVNLNKKSVNVSIPLESVNALLKIIKISNDNLLLMKVGNTKVVFKLGNTEITSATIELNFPDYKVILQNLKTDKTVTVNKLEFLNAMRQMIPISKNNYEARYAIILNFKNDMLNLSAKNESSSIDSSLLCQKKGEDLKISLNSNFLLEATQNMDSDRIQIKMSNSKSSVLLYEENNAENLYLAMPLALRD